MAGGARSDLFGLGQGTARVLFWRGTKKIRGAGGFTDGGGAPTGIPDELFRIAGEFVPAGSNGKGQRDEINCHFRIGGRAGRRGENVPASDHRVR